MPIPEKKSGEDRNTFVSRCISELNGKETSMTQEQIVAVCEKQYDMSKYEIFIEKYKTDNSKTSEKTES